MLGQFANLRGPWPERRGGGWYPNAHYDLPDVGSVPPWSGFISPLTEQEYSLGMLRNLKVCPLCYLAVLKLITFWYLYSHSVTPEKILAKYWKWFKPSRCCGVGDSISEIAQKQKTKIYQHRPPTAKDVYEIHSKNPTSLLAI